MQRILFALLGASANVFLRGRGERAGRLATSCRDVGGDQGSSWRPYLSWRRSTGHPGVNYRHGTIAFTSAAAEARDVLSIGCRKISPLRGPLPDTRRISSWHSPFRR